MLEQSNDPKRKSLSPIPQLFRLTQVLFHIDSLKTTRQSEWPKINGR